MNRILFLFLSLCICGAAQGQIHLYTFTGELPAGASNHDFVADGESWTAVIGLDVSTIDSELNPEFGVYTDAVRFGSLNFSGGYESGLDFNQGNAFILDNVGASDSVRVSGPGYTFQVNNENLDTIIGDSFLNLGTQITPFNDPAALEFFQLTLFDEFGSINYPVSYTHLTLPTIYSV